MKVFLWERNGGKRFVLYLYSDKSEKSHWQWDLLFSPVNSLQEHDYHDGKNNIFSGQIEDLEDNFLTFSVININIDRPCYCDKYCYRGTAISAGKKNQDSAMYSHLMNKRHTFDDQNV